MHLYLLNGTRFIIIIIILSIIVYSYIKRNKQPNKIFVIVLLVALLVLSGIIGFARDGIRYGGAIDWSIFSINNILYVFESDLTIYKPINAFVEKIPSEINFQYVK